MTFKHTCYAAFLIAVVMCMGWSLWWMRPYMPAIALELAICGGILLASGTLATVATLGMGVLALWHWQEGKRHQSRVIPLHEHGSYAVHAGGYQPLMPASVHMAAFAPPQMTVAGQPQAPAIAAPGVLYPQAPPFTHIHHLIGPGRLILGYNTAGPIYGDITDLLSMAFVGKPGTGKSSALLYYLAMLLLVDAQVYVFDHQGSLASLADLLPYYGSFADFAQPQAAIYDDLEEREQLWRNGRQVRRPMLVLVDELPAVARWEAKHKPEYSILDLAEKIVLEHRKHNVYCLLTGQSLPAEVLPTLTRDNLSSRLVFNSSAAHARMAGLDEETRKKLLPLLRKAQPGTAILDVSRRAEPDIAAIPETTIHDLRVIVEAGNSDEAFNELHTDFQELSRLSNGMTETVSESGLHVLSGKSGMDMKDAVKTVESLPELSDEEERQILHIAQAQLATYGKVIRSKIPAAMTPPRNNAVYPAVKAVLDREGL